MCVSYLRQLCATAMCASCCAPAVCQLYVPAVHQPCTAVHTNNNPIASAKEPDIERERMIERESRARRRSEQPTRVREP